MSSMTYKDKKRKTDHRVIGMADSMPQKNRRSVKWKLWHVYAGFFKGVLGTQFGHTAHCFLLLVSCMLYVVKNIALRKPTWIGGQNVG